MIKRLNLNETALCLFIGSLEAEILCVLWDSQIPLTIKDIYKHMHTDKAFTTITTTVARLHRKGLLKQTIKRSSYGATYAVVCDEATFLHTCITLVIKTLKNNYPITTQEVLDNE